MKDRGRLGMQCKWERRKLCDLCDLIAGFAFKSTDFGDYKHKVIKIKNIQPPYVELSSSDGVDISKYVLSKLDKYLVKQDDFVLAMTGATIGKIGRLQKGQAYLNQRVLLFHERTGKVDKNFLYYSLCKQDFLPFVLNHIDSQTAQANISANTIGNYPISLPPFNEQVEIGCTLRALDDKIANNTKINHHLASPRSETDSSPDIKRGNKESRSRAKLRLSSRLFTTRSYSGASNLPMVE